MDVLQNAGGVEAEVSLGIGKILGSGGNHYIADTERGTDLETIGRYGIAWLKLYLDGDVRYERFIYGDLAAPDSDKFSRFVTSP